ncbi:hypothetical protein [Streptomyces sp. 8K308]|uniref:dihydrofolate reductase family protein n=1 Tax=Streptomyces sp. 8K308 TaxID=2530388 RepID=UPI001404C933|nr:hypothetical protein [Streptomyces sp. 8K308]
MAGGCSRSLFCSLDGYHEGPEGELGWGPYDEEFFDWNLRQTREVGALLLGRRTYEHSPTSGPRPRPRGGCPRSRPS